MSDLPRVLQPGAIRSTWPSSRPSDLISTCRPCPCRSGDWSAPLIGQRRSIVAGRLLPDRRPRRACRAVPGRARPRNQDRPRIGNLAARSHGTLSLHHPVHSGGTRGPRLACLLGLLGPRVSEACSIDIWALTGDTGGSQCSEWAPSWPSCLCHPRVARALVNCRQRRAFRARPAVPGGYPA